MRRSPGGAVLAITVASLAALAGCYNWHVETAPPAEVIQQQHPGRIRLTVLSGDRFELKSPTLAGDTIVGEFHNASPPPPYIWRKPGIGWPDTASPPRKGVARVPVADATRLETHHLAVLKTIGVSVLFVALWAGAVAIWFALGLSSS
jgi:hypothetical protein